MYRRVFSEVGEYKKFAVLVPIFVCLEVVFEVFAPIIMTLMIDEGVKKGDTARVMTLGLIMISFCLCALALGALSARFGALAGVGLGKNIRKSMFEKVQNFSFKNIDKFSSGSLLTRFTSDVNFVTQAFSMGIRGGLRAPVMLIFSIAMTFRLNITIGIVFLVVVPVTWLGMGGLAMIMVPRFLKLFKKNDEMNTQIQENITGMHVVKSFVKEDYETEQFKKVSAGLLKAQLHAEKMAAYMPAAMVLAMYLITLIVLWFAGSDIIKGSMSVGTITGVIAYIGQILISMMMIGLIAGMFIMSRSATKRITEVLNEKIDITDEGADENLKVEDGRIEFKNVSFKYTSDAENVVIKDINITIESGQVIGIVGGTGAGKTSLVQLIPRLYDVTTGSVCISGRDVREYKMKNLRDSVSMVLQNNTLFTGTIEENLKWGNDFATEEEMDEACKVAQAYDFIKSFPNGYQTNVSQGGTNLSGGQKQRICLARALLKKPKILILDDSTSAVDVTTEKAIREQTKKIFGQTTVIIIAQRLASVKDADAIIVLDDGKIDDIGTHEELVKKNLIYKQIYKSQAGGAV